MKLGKIYTWLNREEARHLIGKKVIFSDCLKHITEDREGVFGTMENLKDIKNEERAFYDKDFQWRFIREIEEEPEELMTNTQLSEWCAKGNGCWSDGNNVFQTYYSVVLDCKDDPVDDDIEICRWSSDEWIKPTKAVYEQDCKEATE